MGTAVWNTAGLCFGIAGVAMLFRWGPPQPSHDPSVGLGLEDNTPIDETGKTVLGYGREVEAQKERYQCLSRLGLALLGLGFALQLGGIWLAT